jgi:hypothetical protein
VMPFNSRALLMLDRSQLEVVPSYGLSGQTP